MEIACTKKEEQFFSIISEAGQALGFPCYIIGGFVRDKIIGRKTKDADIVCQGDGIVLAHKVADLMGPRVVVNYFKNFGTAQISVE
ncbi:MAG: tRNA nucleotidyltransferase, partial [Chitinophagaceae bacterium]